MYRHSVMPVINRPIRPPGTYKNEDVEMKVSLHISVILHSLHTQFHNLYFYINLPLPLISFSYKIWKEEWQNKALSILGELAH